MLNMVKNEINARLWDDVEDWQHGKADELANKLTLGSEKHVKY